MKEKGRARSGTEMNTCWSFGFWVGLKIDVCESFIGNYTRNKGLKLDVQTLGREITKDQEMQEDAFLTQMCNKGEIIHHT